MASLSSMKRLPACCRAWTLSAEPPAKTKTGQDWFSGPSNVTKSPRGRCHAIRWTSSCREDADLGKQAFHQDAMPAVEYLTGKGGVRESGFEQE